MISKKEASADKRKAPEPQEIPIRKEKIIEITFIVLFHTATAREISGSKGK